MEQITLSGRSSTATGLVRPPGSSTNQLSVPGSHSHQQRAGSPPGFPLVPKPSAERPWEGGRSLATLNPKTLCSSRKVPCKAATGQQDPAEGLRASPCLPFQPSPQCRENKRSSSTHRSSWEGWMYPEERMFRDRMLGSMRDSSASGVFRIRPASVAQG